MCRSGQSRVWVAAGVTTGAVLLLASCATTNPQPQQFRSFFVPPARTAKVLAPEPLAEPPGLPQGLTVPALDLYAYETPSRTSSLPSLPRPADGEFVIRQADERFNAGKRALQEGRTADSRREFNRAIEILLAAPENMGDRTQVERRLEELADAIYKYDLDQQAAAGSSDPVSYEKRPLDEILEATFPVEPTLRDRVKEQIQATASQLPLQETDAVISYINFFTSERGKRILAAGLRYSGRYKAMISRVLADEGVPQELIFLAQAESGFQPRARSWALCVGLWQFEKSRGREYGLMQTASTDDRMDPEKATRAAAHHLHDLYSHFGDWYLAMAAYNCGPQCVDRAVARTGYADFWALRRLGVLPQETANYVPAILAMTIIAKNAKDYGLDNVEFAPPLEYDTVQLSSSTHLALVAAALDRPVSEIRELNPAVMRTVAPGGYALHVPKGTLPQLAAAFEAVPSSHRDTWRVHRVEAGDSFTTIAKRYGTTPGQVSIANADALPDAGSFVAIPVSYPIDRTLDRAAAKPSAVAAGKTGVKPGVKLASSSIAARTAAAPAKLSTAKAVVKPAAPASPAAKPGTAQTGTAKQKNVPAKSASISRPSSVPAAAVAGRVAASRSATPRGADPAVATARKTVPKTPAHRGTRA